MSIRMTGDMPNDVQIGRVPLQFSTELPSLPAWPRGDALVGWICPCCDHGVRPDLERCPCGSVSGK